MAYEILDDEPTGRYEVLPASVAAGKDLNSIPRQVGLTARYGLEGLANTAQLVTEPLRYITDRITGSTGQTVPLGVLASRVADFIGLPNPENADERVVGDAARMAAGAGGLAGAGAAAGNLGGWIGRAGQALAANPVQQIGAGAGAGLGGGASREAGGGAIHQAVAATLGGVAGGMVMDGPWITLPDAPGLGITAVHGLTNVKVFDV